MSRSISVALGSRKPSVVTSSTRQSGRSEESSRTTSRAAVLLPTATLPPSAIRNGTPVRFAEELALGGATRRAPPRSAARAAAPAARRRRSPRRRRPARRARSARRARHRPAPRRRRRAPSSARGRSPQTATPPAASATTRPRPRFARILAAALEVAPRHHGLPRVLAPPVLDVAVVGALTRHLAQVPAHAADEFASGGHIRPAASRLSSRANSPEGALRCDSDAGTSVVGSPWARMALIADPGRVERAR